MVRSLSFCLFDIMFPCYRLTKHLSKLANFVSIVPTVTMNMKMENKAKFEIVDAILRKLDIAMEYNGDVRKIILDFVSQLSPDEHTATLNELEDAWAIKGFKH